MEGSLAYVQGQSTASPPALTEARGCRVSEVLKRVCRGFTFFTVLILKKGEAANAKSVF
jgi:hypothetical protein